MFTRWAIVELQPSSLERVAGYLAGLLEREPMKSRPGWENERIVLGCLVTDLRSMVMAAGEPVGPARDLRDARTKADERSAAQRMELAESSYHVLIDHAIEDGRRARERRADELNHAPDPAPGPVTPAAATPDTEIPAWS